MHQIEAQSIGEAWNQAITLILKEGHLQNDEDRQLKEILELSIEITNPNEDDPEALKYPNDRAWMHANFTEIKRIPELKNAWSYGWRLSQFQGIHQLDWIIQTLTNKRESKSATITFLQGAGIEGYVPCVSLLDFKIRNSSLLLTACCRSLDFGHKALHNFCELAAIGHKITEKFGLAALILHVHVISAHIYEEDWA